MSNNKIKQSTDCKNGKHNFIVTQWQTKGIYKKAMIVRCRNCLTALNMQEIESIEWSEENNINVT